MIILAWNYKKVAKYVKKYQKKRWKAKIYATKSKKFKQLHKALKNSQHLCSLERCASIIYYVVSQTIATSGKMFKRKHKPALFYVGNLGIGKIIVYNINKPEHQ